MADGDRGWRQFQGKKFDIKHVLKRIKKAETATTKHAHKFIVKRLDNIRVARRQIVGWLLLMALLIVAVGAQLMWFQRSYQTTADDTGGTYAEATRGPIDTLNPLYAQSSAETSASQLLFSSLYSYDSTGHLHSDLATGMKIDETGTKYTVDLRPDAKWHDGELVTAKDVVFTVDLIKDPESRTALAGTWRNINVKALSDTTVEFTLPAVIAPFSHALTFAILPEHILGKVPAGAVRENVFSKSPIGSGPFAFRLLQTASTGNHHKIIHMTAFDDYYKGALKLSRFEIHAYETTDDIKTALMRGEVSGAMDLAIAGTSGIDTFNYHVTSKPINSGVYALFNNDTAILKDVNVRRALQVGTDTNAVRESLASKVPALDTPFVNGQLKGEALPRAPKYDKKQAEALLDEAGWVMTGGVRQKEGKKLTLTITTTQNSQYEKVVNKLSAQWKQLGIIVAIKVVDVSDSATDFIQNTLQPRSYDVLVYELPVGADPDVFAYWHSSQVGSGGRNFSNYKDALSDAILVSARSRLEPELRNAKYKSFANQWLEQAPAIGLYQPVLEYISNKSTSVYLPSTLIAPYGRYSDIQYWSVSQKSVYKTP